jgi:ribosome maturation factor RimP
LGIVVIFLDTNNRLYQELAAIADDEGLAVYDVELGAPATIRIFIERAAQGERVTGDETGGLDTVSQERSEEGSSEGQMESLPDSAPKGRALKRVTSGDCSRLVRRLMAFFLAQGESFGMSKEPRIEVSSPGMNRTLRTPEHFNGAVGERILVQTEVAVTGNLIEFDGSKLKILDEKKQQPVEFRLSEVKKARVEFAFK